MNDTYVCKYCGKTFPFEKGGCNPSDYGLHYSDSDIYGREFTCIACDKLVTMTNRYIKYAIQDGFTKASLQRVVKHVEWVRDNIDGMKSQDNIEVFHETRKLVETNKTLKLLTSTAMEQTSIVEEGFHSPKAPFYSDMEITVEEAPTLAAAGRLADKGFRVAVLNFANPIEPGGGVLRGANAQEEYLCRASNLWYCLKSEKVADYYQHHQGMVEREKGKIIGTNRVIYSPWVTVFREDQKCVEGNRVGYLQVLTKKWKQVDVITCAAPCFTYPQFVLPEEELRPLFEARIRNILEAAIDHKMEALVLGAFGCGAFLNPPELVAEVFREVLAEERYAHAFRKVVFAIIGGGDNLTVFQEVFKGDDNKRKNPYKGKKISILGDSISTLEGWNPEGYNVFFTEINRIRAKINDWKDTWWGRVVCELEAQLLVNNSWSGSRVSRLPDSKELFPSGCSDERTGGLHKGDELPDVILVYLGTNDFGYGVVPRRKRLFGPDDGCFSDAYQIMLLKLKKNYPKSEIYCCTLNTTYMSSNQDFNFPKSYGGVHMDVYNEIIRDTARKMQCKLIDLAKYEKPYDSMDGSHPNNDGMKTLASMMLREISNFS